MNGLQGKVTLCMMNIDKCFGSCLKMITKLGSRKRGDFFPMRFNNRYKL